MVGGSAPYNPRLSCQQLVGRNGLKCNASQLHVTLMIDEMKAKYVLTFRNSFLKIGLNCDLENYVNCKYTL